MTLARNAAEEATLQNALAPLTSLGMPVAVGDGGSTDAFVEFLRARPQCTVLTGARGLVPQIQASLGHAFAGGARFVLYTEPDKQFFFQNRLAALLDTAPPDADLGVVLASRSRDSYATFPAIQQYTEGVVNRLAAEVTGIEGDYCYGPFLVNRKLAPYVETLTGALGWGWRPHLFVVAHRLGLKLRHVVGDFPCPADQRGVDETVHRIRQLGQNAEGMVSGVTARL